jgi:DNA-binding FrmR family transcriptional regulator
MELAPDQMVAVVNRLKRVTQLAAVNRALDRAGFAIIATGLKQCLAEQEEDGAQSPDLPMLEKLFLSLA